MNSSRLRSASAAPKLAITMMMTVLLLRAQAAEQHGVERQRQAAGQARSATSAGDGQRPAEGEGRDAA